MPLVRSTSTLGTSSRRMIAGAAQGRDELRQRLRRTRRRPDRRTGEAECAQCRERVDREGQRLGLVPLGVARPGRQHRGTEVPDRQKRGERVQRLHDRQGRTGQSHISRTAGLGCWSGPSGTSARRGEALKHCSDRHATAGCAKAHRPPRKDLRRAQPIGQAAWSGRCDLSGNCLDFGPAFAQWGTWPSPETPRLVHSALRTPRIPPSQELRARRLLERLGEPLPETRFASQELEGERVADALATLLMDAFRRSGDAEVFEALVALVRSPSSNACGVGCAGSVPASTPRRSCRTRWSTCSATRIASPPSARVRSAPGPRRSSTTPSVAVCAPRAAA